MKNFYRPWVILACIIVIALYATVAQIRHDAHAYDYSTTYTMIVERGDSLWKIAEPISQDRNIQRVIDIIQEESDCGATIYPGDVLRIPVFD